MGERTAGQRAWEVFRTTSDGSAPDEYLPHNERWEAVAAAVLAPYAPLIACIEQAAQGPRYAGNWPAHEDAHKALDSLIRQRALASLIARAEALPQPAAKMFAALREGPTTIEGLADALGMQPRGGHWNNGIATLRRNGLIDQVGGDIQLSELVG